MSKPRLIPAGSRIELDAHYDNSARNKVNPDPTQEVRWDDWRLGVVGGLVCPLTGIAIAALLGPLLGLDPMQQGLLIIFGSLPPAVLNFMVAEQFRQEPAKVASIVLIGNVLSAVFIPLGLAIALH